MIAGLVKLCPPNCRAVIFDIVSSCLLIRQKFLRNYYISFYLATSRPTVIYGCLAVKDTNKRNTLSRMLRWICCILKQTR